MIGRSQLLGPPSRVVFEHRAASRRAVRVLGGLLRDSSAASRPRDVRVSERELTRIERIFAKSILSEAIAKIPSYGGASRAAALAGFAIAAVRQWLDCQRFAIRAVSRLNKSPTLLVRFIRRETARIAKGCHGVPRTGRKSTTKRSTYPHQTQPPSTTCV